MDEVVHERRHINVACIALLRIGKFVALNHSLHRVDIVLDIRHLLRLETLFLGIDTRPGNLAGHNARTHTRHFRREGSIIVVVCIDAEDIAARDVAPFHVRLLEFVDIHTLIPALDGFAEDIDTTIVAIQDHFHHLGTWTPVSHLAPKLEGQRVAHHRDVVVRCQQHPVAVGWHSQQGYILLLAIFVARLKGVFLLIETERAVTAQLDTDGAIVALHLHVGCHFLRSVQFGVRIDVDNRQTGRLRIHLACCHHAHSRHEAAPFPLFHYSLFHNYLNFLYLFFDNFYDLTILFFDDIDTMLKGVDTIAFQVEDNSILRVNRDG